MSQAESIPIVAVSPDQAARMLGVGRTAIFALIASKELPSFCIGRRRCVRIEDVAALAARRAQREA